MKKALLIILVSTLIIACMTTAALAAGTGEMTISSATGAPGETVTVTVSLKANPGVAYLNIPITYDSTKLEAPTINGTGLTGWTIGSNAVWVDAGDSTYTGDILQLTFKIKDGTSGTASVSIGLLEAWNSADEAVYFNNTPGTISIRSNTPEPTTKPTEMPKPTATPAPTTTTGISLAPDGKLAKITGPFSSYYARVALVLDNNGSSGLYVTQATINADGTIIIPSFMVPGLSVKGINVALVPTLGDISSATPDVEVSDFKML